MQVPHKHSVLFSTLDSEHRVQSYKISEIQTITVLFQRLRVFPAIWLLITEVFSFFIS